MDITRAQVTALHTIMLAREQTEVVMVEPVNNGPVIAATVTNFFYPNGGEPHWVDVTYLIAQDGRKVRLDDPSE